MSNHERYLNVMSCDHIPPSFEYLLNTLIVVQQQQYQQLPENKVEFAGSESIKFVGLNGQGFLVGTVNLLIPEILSWECETETFDLLKGLNLKFDIQSLFIIPDVMC